jgi:hypothetical protein
MRSHFSLSPQSHLEFVGSVGCVSARPGLRHHEVSDPDNRLNQVSRPLPAVLAAMPARVSSLSVMLFSAGWRSRTASATWRSPPL